MIAPAGTVSGALWLAYGWPTWKHLQRWPRLAPGQGTHFLCEKHGGIAVASPRRRRTFIKFADCFL